MRTATQRTCAAVAALAAVSAPVLQAAPLDALLSARHDAPAFRPEFDLGTDMANRTVDVFGLRPKKSDGSYGPSGDYSGGHLRLGMNLSPAWWVDGALWARKLQYVSVSSRITSWQLASQFRVFDGGDSGLSLAARAGAWGNASPQMRKNTEVTVEGTRFTSATATRPSDRQLQFDLVASWPLQRTLTASAFVGAGSSRVGLDKVSATAQEGDDGCPYDVQFTDSHVIATCDQAGTNVRIAVPNAVYGIDINQEARYRARFTSAGLNAVWTPGPWTLQAGVQGIRMNRGAIDDIVVRRGGQVYTSNTVVVAQLGYQVQPRIQAYLRAQVMAHQFVGEVPLNYNSLTAAQHRRPYGLLSLGLAGSF